MEESVPNYIIEESDLYQEIFKLVHEIHNDDTLRQAIRRFFYDYI